MLRANLRGNAQHIQSMADHAYAATQSSDATDGDRAKLELVGNRATDLVIALGMLR